MGDIPEQSGVPTNLETSILWAAPLQSKVPYIFLCVGSVLHGFSAFAHNLWRSDLSFFSSISVFSFLFSCCRWTITLWRWLGKEGGHVGVGLCQLLGSPPRKGQRKAPRMERHGRLVPSRASPLTRAPWEWSLCVSLEEARPGVWGGLQTQWVISALALFPPPSRMAMPRKHSHSLF